MGWEKTSPIQNTKLDGLNFFKWHFGLQSTPPIPSDVYIIEPSPNISDNDTTDFDIVVNEDQWGEDGVVT
jgi:hypothetical protein